MDNYFQAPLTQLDNFTSNMIKMYLLQDIYNQKQLRVFYGDLVLQKLDGKHQYIIQVEY
jgi:hypothetical protein